MKRRLLAAALMGSAIALACATSAHAQPPSQAEVDQVPGVYRFLVGDAKVTVLSDGALDLDLHKLIRGATADRIDRLLAKDFLRNPVRTSVNVFLIETGDHRVLVDTGIGQLARNGSGRLLQSLSAAGLEPDQITDILVTHAHIDHIGGLVRNGDVVFRNATIHLSEPDVGFYLSSAVGSVPHAAAEASAIAVQMLKPYADRGKIQSFAGRADILPGIVGTVHPGHTPGSAFFTLESRGEKIVFVGDIVHSLVQFSDPAITIAFDTDAGLAKDVREAAFAGFATERTLIAAPHLPFPGVGHVGGADGRFAWVPVSYSDRSLIMFPDKN